MSLAALLLDTFGQDLIAGNIQRGPGVDILPVQVAPVPGTVTLDVVVFSETGGLLFAQLGREVSVGEARLDVVEGHERGIQTAQVVEIQLHRADSVASLDGLRTTLLGGEACQSS